MAIATEEISTATLPSIRYRQLFINGAFVDSASGKTFTTINPATEQPIAEVAEGDAADIDLAVRAARRALEHGPWSRMDASDRGRVLNKLADLIEAHGDELATLETLNSGKILSDSRGDVRSVLNTLRYYAGWADKIEGRTIPVRGSFLSYTLRQPVGVVGQIIPWNFPLLMAAWKLGPALACGNTVVMKPAEQTPLTILLIAALAQEAGLPNGVLNIVNGFGETAGAALVTHPDVDKIAFTGHVDTAKIIQRAAADTLKRVTFELGGKSPNVIFADADTDVDEMLERANTTYYGLAAGIWTKNLDKAHLFAKHVKAGTVWVNCYHVVDAATPFGGFKMSGQGRENGEAALEHYTELKTVTIKLESDVSVLT